MPIYRGNTKVVSLYRGTTKIVKVYKGTNVVYTSSRLPAEFQEVAYIESTGTQYIDSGWYSKDTDTVECKFEIINQNALQSGIYGAYCSNGLSGCGLVASQTTNDDLRVILDNFLNGGVTTEFGTAVTL